MTVVIADDITGAAEIAGIAHSKGLDVKFATRLGGELPHADVLVIATDTRSGSREEAEAVSLSIAEALKGRGVTLFKKTDSVMRGHVVAELTALMRTLGFPKALLLPQNPSKGRVISDGRYFINGVPLHETSFSYDPEFPARTSLVEDYLPGVKSLPLGVPISAGIQVVDAASADEIRCQLAKADGETLFAGAADLFTALLDSKNSPSAPSSLISSPLIVVCGSTQSKTLADEPLLKNMHAEELPMPADVFDGEVSPAAWIQHLVDAYRRSGAVILATGHAAKGGKAYAVRLRDTMADAVSTLVGAQTPATLVIEGGATAFAVLSRLGWSEFDVVAELSAGMVCLGHGSTRIILKPGSYPWGNLWKQPSDVVD